MPVVTPQMSRELFLRLLAQFIMAEVEAMPREWIDATPEPYRAAADRLANDALDLLP